LSSTETKKTILPFFFTHPISSQNTKNAGNPRVSRHFYPYTFTRSAIPCMPSLRKPGCLNT